MITGYCPAIDQNIDLPYHFFWEGRPTATGENAYHVDVTGIRFLALWCNHPKANVPAERFVSASDTGRKQGRSPPTNSS